MANQAGLGAAFGALGDYFMYRQKRQDQLEDEKRAEERAQRMQEQADRKYLEHLRLVKSLEPPTRTQEVVPDPDSATGYSVQTRVGRPNVEAGRYDESIENKRDYTPKVTGRHKEAVGPGGMMEQLVATDEFGKETNVGSPAPRWQPRAPRGAAGRPSWKEVRVPESSTGYGMMDLNTGQILTGKDGKVVEVAAPRWERGSTPKGGGGKTPPIAGKVLESINKDIEDITRPNTDDKTDMANALIARGESLKGNESLDQLRGKLRRVLARQDYTVDGQPSSKEADAGVAAPAPTATTNFGPFRTGYRTGRLEDSKILPEDERRLILEAKEAIRKGADQNKVFARLRDMGVDLGKLGL